ncbi:MAG: AMP-binding protein, partial [Chromatiaceae bacterium]
MSRKSCPRQSAVPGNANFQDAPWHRNRAPAVIDAARPDSSWDYGSLNRRACERSGRLLAQGLRPGELVAVGERPGADLILMQHALARAGAALLPLRSGSGPAASYPTGGDGVAALIQETGAEWIWDGSANRLVPTGRRVPESDQAGEPPWPSPLALVVETSGSSGARRAAMLTTENLLTSAALVNRRLGLGPGDIWLCCLPLRHIGGLSITYRCALAGAAVLLHEGFQAEAVAVDLGRRGVTHVSLVPPMLARLLDLGRPPPPSLRVLLVGGQSLSAPLAHRALESGWPLHVTYGMTETASQVATSDRLTEPPPPGAVGRPFAPMELDCPLCPGEPATLRLRGPLVMAGYASPLRV